MLVLPLVVAGVSDTLNADAFSESMAYLPTFSVVSVISLLNGGTTITLHKLAQNCHSCETSRYSVLLARNPTNLSGSNSIAAT